MGKYAGTKGTVGILNVGVGDIKLSFDKNNPAERIRAARVVKDMLRRGFALLVETDVGGEKKFTRALDFDENACVYVIADFDPVVAAAADANDGGPDGQEQQGEAPAGTAQHGDTKAAPKRRGRAKRVPVEEVRAVSVARTAGG